MPPPTGIPRIFRASIFRFSSRLLFISCHVIVDFPTPLSHSVLTGLEITRSSDDDFTHSRVRSQLVRVVVSRGPQVNSIGTYCKLRHGSCQGKRFQQSRRAVDERNRSNEIRFDVEIRAECPDEVCCRIVNID